MKKSILNILCATTISAIAQNQGTITYQMSIEGLPAEQASMMGDMEMKVIWKDQKSYFEQNSMMYSVKSVSDGNTSLTLMDMMGNKYYIKQNLNDPKLKENEKEAPEYKIEYTNDTKKVAGYDCKKAIVKGKTKEGKDLTIDVWYSEKVPNTYANAKSKSRRDEQTAFLKGIKGMPLEYTIPQGPYTVKVTTKEINFNNVSDDIFNLSTEGYQEMTPEEFKKMSGH